MNLVKFTLPFEVNVARYVAIVFESLAINEKTLLCELFSYLLLKIIRVINFCGFHYPSNFLTTNYFQTMVYKYACANK